MRGLCGSPILSSDGGLAGGLAGGPECGISESPAGDLMEVLAVSPVLYNNCGRNQNDKKRVIKQYRHLSATLTLLFFIRNSAGVAPWYSAGYVQM